ncbi:MAG: DUF6567 family protein [Bacteroidota bacterium]
MTTRRLCLPLALSALLLSGCVSTGVFTSANVTNVELSEGNYTIVATNVSGEASATYLLGASGSVRAEMTTLALVRVGGEPLLYQAALDDLWQNFEAEHGAPEGRRLALVNVRFDSDALNLLVVTQPRVSIRADVVEFTP